MSAPACVHCLAAATHCAAELLLLADLSRPVSLAQGLRLTDTLTCQATWFRHTHETRMVMVGTGPCIQVWGWMGGCNSNSGLYVNLSYRVGVAILVFKATWFRHTHETRMSVIVDSADASESAAWVWVRV